MGDRSTAGTGASVSNTSEANNPPITVGDRPHWLIYLRRPTEGREGVTTAAGSGGKFIRGRQGIDESSSTVCSMEEGVGDDGPAPGRREAITTRSMTNFQLSSRW